MPVPVDISEGFYETSSKQLADLICNNLRPFVPDAPSKAKTALKHTDGIDSFIDSTHKIARGSIEVLGVPYFVQGNQLFSIDILGARTDLGTITGTGRVSLAASQSYIWIVVPGAASYYFNISTQTLTTNVDPNFLGPAISVSFKDSFFVFTTDSIIFNANLDGITFTPTDFGTAEFNRDKIITGFVSNNQYYAAGSASIQVYRTTGGAGFPFSAVPNSTLDKGLASQFGFVRANNTFFFIGGGENEQAAIYRYLGGSAEKISTIAIDEFIQGLSDDEIQGVFAWSYQSASEEYVGFTFANRTFVYQIQTSQKKGRHIWHERTSSATRWRVNTIVKAYNNLYVGDERTDKIGIINSDTFTEYGDTVFREFSTQPFNFEGAPAFVGQYEMIMATGVGNASSTNPVVQHKYSINGVNYGPIFTRSIGEAGKFNHRVVWRKMGDIEQQRVLYFSTNEPCETFFYYIEAGIELGE